jgi:hypothetical protein
MSSFTQHDSSPAITALMMIGGRLSGVSPEQQRLPVLHPLHSNMTRNSVNMVQYSLRLNVLQFIWRRKRIWAE